MTATRTSALFAWIDRRFVPLALACFVAAIAIGAVGTAVRDDSEPSFDPDGEIYDIAERADDVFESSSTVRPVSFLVDTEEGRDVLTRDGLLSVAERIRSARTDPANDAHLVEVFDQNLGVSVDGIISIAAAVDEALPGGLAAATDDEVKLALASVLDPGAPTGTLRFTLAQTASSEPGTIDGQPTTIWRAPAYQVEVRYDLATFTDEETESARDRAGERWLRDLQDDLRVESGDDGGGVRVLGVGVDPLLTAEEQFTAGGPFIFLAVGLIVILVGVLMRSYWASAVVGSGLGVTLLSYNGILGLVGVKMTSQLILFVVPITLVAFGVDFFVHAAGRVREAHAAGRAVAPAYTEGMVAVVPALSLAAATSIAAFLSNAASGIEAIVEFGLAAALGLVIAYGVLGWLAPRAVLGIERWVGVRPSGPRSRVARGIGVGIGFVLLALGAGAVVSMTALAPAIGVLGLPPLVVGFVAVPAVIVRRRRRPWDDEATSGVAMAGHRSQSVGAVVHLVARWRYVTLALFATLGAVGLAGAVRVESAFEVSDFFSRKTDFIAGLDRLDRYYGGSIGGPAYLYLEGDLTEPGTLQAIESTMVELDGADADFARDLDGQLIVTPNAVDIVRTTMSLPGAAEEVARATGVTIEDLDGDGLPDDATAVAAIYRSAREQGVTGADGTTVFTAEQVESYLAVDGATQATRVEVLVTSFTDDAIILDARSALEDAGGRLSATLGAAVPVVAVSGEVLASQDSLAAFTRAMVVSLPIAVVVTVLIVGLAIRSVRYSIVTILPILLVVFGVWGYMWVRGFTINVVTATIAAIAVGVGIDFCTHFTVRFREELAITGDRFEAVRLAGDGTGGALAISALTSIAGFGVMTAAPAPIFASFGELMAVMILLSAVVALLVLPCLLVIATRPVVTTDTTDTTVVAGTGADHGGTPPPAQPARQPRRSPSTVAATGPIPAGVTEGPGLPATGRPPADRRRG